MDLLDRLKLVNRSNLRVSRIYREVGNNIELTFIASPLKKGFKTIVDLLEEDMKYERQQSLDKEAIKIRILSILKERNLTNKEIRQMTGMTDKQV